MVQVGDRTAEGHGRLLQPRRRRGRDRRPRPRRSDGPLRPRRQGEQQGAVLGYPQDGPFDAQPVRIRSDQRLRSPDIYGNGTVTRQVFSLRGLIRPGQLRRPARLHRRPGARRRLRRLGQRPADRLRADRRPGTPRRRPVGRSAVRERQGVPSGNCACRTPETARTQPAVRLNAAGICLPCSIARSGALTCLIFLYADEAEQSGDQQVDDEDDQEAPGEVEPGEGDEVGERHRQHDDREQGEEGRPPANRPMLMPPALTETLSSDLASAISLWIRLETSRLASTTSLPIVGSSVAWQARGVPCLMVSLRF